MIMSWIARNRSAFATVVSGGVIAALVTTLAVVTGGYTAQQVRLGDGAVWVAKGDDQVIGRANTEVLELNSVVEADGGELEIVQRGATVLVMDRANSRLDVVDPSTSSVVDEAALPTAAPRVFLAGDNATVTDSSGRVWVLPADLIGEFDLDSQPTLSLGGDAVYSMDENGILAAYSEQAEEVYRIDAAGGGEVLDSIEAPFGQPTSELQVAWIADHWVLFDAVHHLALIDGREIDLSTLFSLAQRPRLQSSSASGDSALLSFPGGLLEVPFTSGEPRMIVGERSGFAARPLVFNGCRFAAWSDGTLWRDCDDPTGIQFSLESMPAGASQLEFTVNGDRVVLNDRRGGNTWAVQRSGELIDNWDELVTTLVDEETIVVDDPNAEIEFERAQRPPVAVDDEFGARPGRTSVLPVLLNDHDPNGDALVVTSVSGIDESIGHLDLINNRQQVQVTLTGTASGTFTFTYTISDGRGGEDSATVTVTVRSPSENSPPRQVWPSSALVAQGGRVTTSVLGDWVDPDGDPIYLASASTPPPDSVTFTASGTVVFSEGGAASRSRTVNLVVTDGRAEGVGSLSVSVSPVGEVPIVAENFVVLGYAGQELRVEPLDHVRGGSDNVRLSTVSPVTGATVSTNHENGTFRFMSETPRTYLLQYVVTDGSQSATGVARIDVAAPPDANTRPVTVPKTVFVQTLGTSTVDIASMDIDPSGGVLLVTGVYNVPLRSGVQVELIEHRSARVTLTAPLDEGPVTFNYRVSNGLAEAEGVVTVIEIPRPARLQPPVPENDSVSVRVGAVVDIPVLANDVHPDGEELTLEHELAVPPAEGGGLLFASGNSLRYLAPDVPGDFTATYTVTGPDGQSANARVSITVRERIEATNRAPAPLTVTARVLAGESVVIPIPLTGIDPDGDTVQLLGQESNPEKGSVTAAGPSSLQYEAGAYSAGSDSFTYTVMDALGARATGTVRIGISPRLDGPRNPVAVPDSVSMRPGGSVTVQVLANDSDPDGSPLTVIGVDPNDDEVEAVTDGEVVTVTPPAIPGDYGIVYTIQNEFGGTSSAFLTVTVDPDAPRAYPVIRDAVLNLTDILELETIDVNVLAGAFWADGPVSELGVSLVPGYEQGATVTDTKRVRVTIGDRSQIIPFAVSHPDDASLRSLAFVWVPGYDDALPQVNRRAPALTIPSESTLTINLNEYVIAIGGGPVWLTDTSTVHATHANGDSLVIDRQTLQFTSADKYFGPASISFDVTDGSTWDDPDGRRATLVLPITVTPRENQPPVFNGAVLALEPAEERVLDLVRLTTYPYPDDIDELAYTALPPLPTGFSYSLTGQQLTVRANEDAVKGTSTALVLGVRDDLEEGKPGRIELTVVASSRPLAVPAPDTFVAPRGETTVFDVLANDQGANPFPGSPMTVVDVRGADGEDLPPGVAVQPSADNRRLTVTVSADAVPGDINLQYQVLDATRDPDRAVWGNVRVQIQDVPDPVTGARVTSFGDGRVTVAWSPGPANNSPITGYEVTATRADTGTVASVTPCSVTSGCDVSTPGNGPANGLRLSVVAINSIGKSEPTNVPGTVWSDVLPAAVGGVSAVPTNLAPGGGSIGISWSSVADPPNGSPVQSYVVRITGAGVDLSITKPATATGHTYDNAGGVLSPNTAYSVSVYARNSAQVASESAWQRNAPVSVTTVGPPGPVTGGVSGVVINAQGHVRVSWGTAHPNGAPGVTYSVGRFVEGEALPSDCQAPTPGSGGADVSAREWVDETVGDQVTYRYVVYADNGYYCTVNVSGPVITMQRPGKASGSTSIQYNNGTWDIRVGDDLAVASLTAEKFQVSLNGGAFTDVTPGTFLVGVVPYGGPVSVQYRGCRDATDAFCGAPSDAVTVTPVNVRSSILQCRVGEDATASVPANPGGSPTATFEFSFHDGGPSSEWTPFSPDATVPPPAPPVDPDDPDEPPAIVKARVKATVDPGDGTPRTDQGHSEPFNCEPAAP